MGNIFFHKRSSNHCPASKVIDFSWFTILRSIGRGSYGKVCIAQKRDTKKLYAMKYMDKIECIKEGAVANILQELRLLKLIDHPHIVNLRFAFHDVEDMCLVVDLLQGGDLRYHLNKVGRFSEHSVTVYLLELSSAIQYLHSLRIIHRDIKPDNLLLGLDGHIHLTDFNVATQLDDIGMSKSQCGTWHYMAPEIFLVSTGRIEGYSYSVDWWSLGVTCYELTHDELPFDVPRSTAEVVAMYNHSPHIHFSSRLSPPFVSALRQMMSIDRDIRMKSITNIAASLAVSYDDILSHEIEPDFVPSLKKLNVDPAYELEELIIESKPIHKKQSRLSKTTSADGANMLSTTDANSEILALIEREFEPFDYQNRTSALIPAETEPSLNSPDEQNASNASS